MVSASNYRPTVLRLVDQIGGAFLEDPMPTGVRLFGLQWGN